MMSLKENSVINCIKDYPYRNYNIKIEKELSKNIYEVCILKYYMFKIVGCVLIQ